MIARMIPILKHYSDIVSGILSGSKWHIYSKILSDIPSGIYFVIASGILSASILTCFLAYILTFSLASHKAFSDIHSIWRLVAMCPLLSRARGWGAGGRGEGEGEGAVIKSRNPHLAGGEQSIRPLGKSFCPNNFELYNKL